MHVPSPGRAHHHSSSVPMPRSSTQCCYRAAHPVGPHHPSHLLHSHSHSHSHSHGGRDAAAPCQNDGGRDADADAEGRHDDDDDAQQADADDCVDDGVGGAFLIGCASAVPVPFPSFAPRHTGWWRRAQGLAPAAVTCCGGAGWSTSCDAGVAAHELVVRQRRRRPTVVCLDHHCPTWRRRQ